VVSWQVDLLAQAGSASVCRSTSGTCLGSCTKALRSGSVCRSTSETCLGSCTKALWSPSVCRNTSRTCLGSCTKAFWQWHARICQDTRIAGSGFLASGATYCSPHSCRRPLIDDLLHAQGVGRCACLPRTGPQRGTQHAHCRAWRSSGRWFALQPRSHHSSETCWPEPPEASGALLCHPAAVRAQGENGGMASLSFVCLQRIHLCAVRIPA